METVGGGETRIQLCGRLKADVEGKHVTPELRGRQGRVLLAYLVLNRGRPVSRDELITALWPQHPPTDPGAALRTQLSRLRGALGAGALAGRDTVELQLPASTWVDIEAAERAIETAESALAASEWKDAWAHANVALNISSRPFLAGFDAPWTEAVRRELAELQTRARESIARAGIGLGGSELAGAERSARELVRTASFRESGYVLLMRALVASGNTAEALRVYERLRSVLRDELGTAPGAEIQALHRRLLTGREAEEDPEVPAATQRAAAVRDPGPVAPELPLPTWLVPARRSPFVGRTGELGRLEDLWEESAAGQPRVVLVGGEPGMGKTRLATEFAQGVHDAAGAQVLYGRADEHGTLSYQPFVEALRHWAINASPEELSSALGRHAAALGRLLPEITIRLPESSATEGGELARDLLFEAVSETLSAIASARPTLLVIDDLHWADQGSLLMFRHLARSPHRSGLMVLATHRETEPSDALTETLADLGRERLFERIRLSGLGPDETAALVSSIQGSPSSPELVQAIHTETGGNPFLVEALVQHLTEHGQTLEELGAGGRSPREAIYAGGVPSLVREAVAHRATQLGGDVKRVLEVASVVGREFEPDVLAEVSRLPAESVVAALETAVTAGLLIDVPGTLDRYAFSHSLFRQTAYSALPKPRRTALHSRLAAALEHRHGHDPQHVAELARHFSAAGAPAAPKALEYCVRAGAAALGAFSYEEAIEHYSHALVAIEMAASDDERLRCEVLLALGEAEWRAGHIEDARETYARAARIARAGGDAGALGRAALGFCGFGWERFGDPDPEAGQLLKTALAAEPEDAVLRAKLTARLADVLASGGEWQRAEELSSQALETARESGDASALANALIGRWYARVRPDALEERMHLSAELLDLCETLKDRDLALQAQTLRARIAAETGDMDALTAAIAEHEKLADQSKQPGSQLHSRAYRATRALIRGRFNEVERLAVEVIELGMLARLPGALHYSSIELVVLRWEQGRLEELEEPLRELAGRTEAAIWRAALALLCTEIGEEERAAAELEALSADRCAAVPFDENWLGALSFLALASANLGNREVVLELRELLAPYSGRFVMIGAGAACIGPVARFLGWLAYIDDDADAAVALLEQAAEESHSTGSELWLTRAHMGLGLALRARGDAERAEQLIADSAAAAERLGIRPAGRPAAGRKPEPELKAGVESSLQTRP